MEFLVVLVVLALVVLFVTRPLWRTAGTRSEAPRQPDQVADLEAAREAKYREIRDAELDRRTGKLSEEDYQAVDRVLRAEAIEILHALDRARDGMNGAAERLPSEQQ